MRASEQPGSRTAICWSALLLLALVTGGSLHAQVEAPPGEEILRFESTIEVDPDGWISVTEQIQVRALGQQIRRGIFRDLPLEYKGPFFTRVKVPFELGEVLRDGAPEPHHTESRGNGIRIYIGNSNVSLEPGIYTYSLSYRTGRQLGFFDDHDELYWNVTGNDWSFPIRSAVARVELPPSVPLLETEYEGYTGRSGSKEKALTVGLEGGAVRFVTSRELRPGEGLTIVASFPKGHVRPPTANEKRLDFVAANKILFAALVSFLLVLGYYTVAWVAFGRDPRKGTIIPIFEPPNALPPACIRFLDRMRFDRKCLTAAIVDMAVRGYARIDNSGKSFVLERISDDESLLSPGERQIAKHLLSGQKRFTFKKSSAAASKMKKAIKGLRSVLKLEYEGQLFFSRRGWFGLGVALSALCVLLTSAFGPAEQMFGFLFLFFWLTLWSVGTFAMVSAAIGAWRNAMAQKTTFATAWSLAGALFSSAFAIPFVLGLVIGGGFMTMMTSPWMTFFVLALVLTNVLFYNWLKQPTRAGRQLMDQIEGFRMYLETAESQELRTAAPELTPERYQRLLPYAIALGVENEWSTQFDDAMRRAGQEPQTSSSPAWYSGSSWSEGGAAAFAGALGGAMTAAIASSSTAPGSSSGGGGGGSSGGGGGGGGGGGW